MTAQENLQELIKMMVVDAQMRSELSHSFVEKYMQLAFAWGKVEKGEEVIEKLSEAIKK